MLLYYRLCRPLQQERAGSLNRKKYILGTIPTAICYIYPGSQHPPRERVHATATLAHPLMIVQNWSGWQGPTLCAAAAARAARMLPVLAVLASDMCTYVQQTSAGVLPSCNTEKALSFRNDVQR
jgi:hypothetical protein